jgi:hypothetical protein
VIDDVLVGAVVLSLSVAGCGQSQTRRDPIVAGSGSNTGSARASGCQEKTMSQDVLRLRETTNPSLSKRQVGISNIFERDLPDASGAVASRLSAVLVIFDPETKESRRETVIESSVVTIGDDRYCVVALEEGKNEPGWVSIRKM